MSTQPASPKQKRQKLFVLAFLLSLPVLCGLGWLSFDRWQTRNLFNEARTSLSAYHPLEAAGLLNEYLSRRPDDFEAWLLAARTARRLERLTEAAQFLERCQAISGPTEATKLEWDLLRVQQGDIRGIDKRLRQSIGPDHPDASAVLEALALGYMRVERLQDAVQACDMLIEREPKHPWPWLWRGKISERLGQFAKAGADYRQAVENGPDELQCRLALGKLLLHEHSPKEAAAQFGAALQSHPNDLSASLGLAGCLNEQGQSTDALSLLGNIRLLHPNCAEALALSGRAYLDTNNPIEAEKCLREALKLSPNEPEYLYQLTQALRATNQETEATAMTERVAQLRSDFAKLDNLVHQIARKSDDPNPRHEAGVVSLKVGRTEEGLRLLLGLLALPGNHRKTHQVLSDFYRKKGDAERAEYHLLQAETPKAP